MFNFVLAATPNTDDTLHGLLDLRPWDDADLLQYDDGAVIRCIRKNPGGAAVRYNFKTKNGRGGATSLYPVFRIVSLGGSLRTIKTCRAAFSAAFSATHQSEQPVGAPMLFGPPTLLHTACIYKSSAKVVQWIYRQDPRAVKVTNKYGFTPLHCACAYGASVEVVILLVDWHQSALNAKISLGETPHDSAVNNGASDDVIVAVCSGINGNTHPSSSVTSLGSRLEPTA